MEVLSGRNASADSNIAAGPSKLIAALDALSLDSNEGDDSEVEIVAVGPAPIKPKGSMTMWRKKINASERCELSINCPVAKLRHPYVAEHTLFFLLQ